MRILRLGTLLKKTARDWHREGALRLSAALAYYAVFSIAPLLVIITFLVGLIHRGDTLEQVRIQFADFVNPDAADVIARGVVSAGLTRRGNIGYTVFAAIMLILGASAFTHELQIGLDTIWNLRLQKKRRFHGKLLHRLWTLLLGTGMGIFLFVSVLLNSETSPYRHYINTLLPRMETVWRWVDNGISFAIVVVIYSLTYKLLPSVKVLWRDVAGGALVAALLFSAGKWVIGLYVLQNSFSSVYGAAGSLMILLSWLYYCSLVFLFGAKFTQTCAEYFGRPMVQSREPRPQE
jgi:membrane protein